MPVTERFVIVLVVVLDFGSLRTGAEFKWEEFRIPVLQHSDTPLLRLFEDDDEDEYDSKILPGMPNLLQGGSTLI
ncbi:MAG: hypothetical protein JO170_08300 [Verrucomicrobia bacterium]|nr:hypothetical protein [Verrucomicrobiota bacterium]